MAFSIEPGIYPGPHGARIEDIVVCADPATGPNHGRPNHGRAYQRLNNAPATW